VSLPLSLSLSSGLSLFLRSGASSSSSVVATLEGLWKWRTTLEDFRGSEIESVKEKPKQEEEEKE
jgi:hypothetical protein